MPVRIRSRRFALGVTALTALAVAVLPAAAGAESAATQRALTSGAYFNRLDQPDDRLVDHLIDLVNGTPDGEVISGTAFAFDEPGVTDALIEAAAQRHVEVRLITDARTYEEPEAERLRDGLSGRPGSWVRGCPGSGEDNACIGASSMHNKFFTFSKTSGSSWVVSTSSANLNDGSGRNLYNSTYTHVGDQGLYDEFNRYFSDLRIADPDAKYYEHNPPVITGNTKSYFYPRGAGDTVTNTLKSTACPGSIHVGMWSISRGSPTEELRRLADEGCEVQVIAHNIYDQACENLTQSGPGKITLYGFKDGEPYIHQKNILLNATYTGEPHQVVFTGSANLNNPSLRDNDENVIRVMDEPKTYEAFLQNFNAMVDVADYKVTTEADCKNLFHGQD